MAPAVPKNGDLRLPLRLRKTNSNSISSYSQAS